ncbi:DUF6221 family protein [Streptomyces sp. NPDC050732]|uniref:DUF6221 family protein n=1 Tax=Streptomyces sp. NPDC050732 TaxID=3154632 RepID=UPI00342939AE
MADEERGPDMVSLRELARRLVSDGVVERITHQRISQLARDDADFPPVVPVGRSSVVDYRKTRPYFANRKSRQGAHGPEEADVGGVAVDDVVRWYGEQLNEDEVGAQDCVTRDGRWRALGESVLDDDNAEVVTLCDLADAAHVARQDPARVLREIDANRRRLERHTPQLMVGRDSNEGAPSTYVLGCPTCQAGVVVEGDWPCEEVRDMLVSYADRPGYREEWRP